MRKFRTAKSGARNVLLKFARRLRGFFYHGSDRFCPVCGKTSRQFVRYGIVPREDAQCVHCGALERHRFLWSFLERKLGLFEDRRGKMLHIAPESCFEEKFSKIFDDNYVTADLSSPDAMVKMDVVDIPFSDEAFDVIYCSHVLEHVPDDRKAMRELFRVLKDDGLAVLLVPLKGEKTYENSSIVDPAERLKHFGQEDHVRIYGRDYTERLQEAGFLVEMCEVKDLFGKDDAIRMGLTAASGEIFYCTKMSADCS